MGNVLCGVHVAPQSGPRGASECYGEAASQCGIGPRKDFLNAPGAWPGLGQGTQAPCEAFEWLSVPARP